MSFAFYTPISPEELEKTRMQNMIRIRAQLTEKAALPPNPLNLEGFIFPDNLISNNLYKLVGRKVFGGDKYWNLVRFIKHDNFWLTLTILPNDHNIKVSTSIVGLYDIDQNVDGIPFRGTPRDLVETMKIIAFERRKHAIHGWHESLMKKIAKDSGTESRGLPLEGAAGGSGEAATGAGKGGGKLRRKKKYNKRKRNIINENPIQDQPINFSTHCIKMPVRSNNSWRMNRMAHGANLWNVSNNAATRRRRNARRNSRRHNTRRNNRR